MFGDALKEVSFHTYFHTTTTTTIYTIYIELDNDDMESSKRCSIFIFTITTEIHVRSMANFYCQVLELNFFVY